MWLHAEDKKRFSEMLQALMNEHDWLISPVVRLELQYLHEIGRIAPTADTVVAEVSHRRGLTVCPKPFDRIVTKAMQLSWTRDPFNRILVAHASLDNTILVTADHSIRDNYIHAVWQID